MIRPRSCSGIGII